ncbi:MAG: hypothetical protein HYY39_08260 [Armatimonadetes bacterium]|nr:hypothetical protein [Armatimonadota bacterium]
MRFMMNRHDRTTKQGWIGHREIPRPAVVRREHRHTKTDWLDCLLAIWIAEAMLEWKDLLPRPAKTRKGPGTA